MGQYKQWLYYREIDRQLHVQLKRLEEEFVHLQIHLDAQAVGDPTAEPVEQLSSNPIVQALARSFQAQAPTNARDEQPPDSSLQQHTPALFPTSPPRPDLTPLPEDMTAFMQQYAQQTSPSTPPWWVDTLPPTEPAGSPVDGQSVRTNNLVQRWFERWGSQPGEAQEAPEDQP